MQIQLLRKMPIDWNDGYNAIIKTNCFQFKFWSAFCLCNINSLLNLVPSYFLIETQTHCKCTVLLSTINGNFKTSYSSQLIIEFY